MKNFRRHSAWQRPKVERLFQLSQEHFEARWGPSKNSALRYFLGPSMRKHAQPTREQR